MRFAARPLLLALLAALALAPSAHALTTSSGVAAGAGANDGAAADFNRDGHLDVATAHFADGTVSILLGDGTGHFGAPLSIPTGSGPEFVAAGDFNADRNPDLAVGNGISGTISILLG
ncbi:MAG TPA: VCBS repeat-containing protein, partial [Solirubrobacteraceae bacterium]